MVAMLSVTASRHSAGVVAWFFAIEAAEAGTSERHAPACYGVGAGSAGTPTGTLERGGTARGLVILWQVQFARISWQRQLDVASI